MRTITLFLALLMLFAAARAVAQHPAPVKVEGGLVQGVSDDGVTVYKGIPFAAPPVGGLRWRAPQPPVPWKGIRRADRFAPNPMQEMREKFGPWTSEYQPQGMVREDCLYLNVWTAANTGKEKRPVVMYIPGGAFTGGSGNVPVYDGVNLAKKGLVVVTINYRVGVLGFLAHPELTKESEHNSSGNYGLLDQVAALVWIRKNIAAFGGDPGSVTIMGQSAGAMSVHYLTASPLARGLFIRAIAQSGSSTPIGPGERLSSAEKTGRRFAAARGAASLAELRTMPAADVIAPTKDEFHFLPIIDGWFLPESVDEIVAAGEQNDVATLTGWVADEGSFSGDYGRVSGEEFQKRVRLQAGVEADRILQLYPAAAEGKAAESQKAIARDVSVVSMSLWAEKRARTGRTNVYTYVFTHPQPGATQERYQTFHSSELPYIFENLQQSPRPWTAEDERIARTMSAYWTNFIAAGDPNGKGLPRWPAFGETPDQTMALGDTTGPRPVAGRERLEALKRLWQGASHAKFDLTGPRDPSRIRGFNYSPARIVAPGHSTGWWATYDSAKIVFDLNLATRLNLNQVRVFVPYASDPEEREALPARLRHFVRECQKRGIGVMPVVESGPWVKDTSKRARGREWVRFLVNALSNEPGLAFWDAMNEPDWPPSPKELVGMKFENARFMARTFRECDPNTPVTLGMAFVDGMIELADCVDVLQFHDYMQTREQIRNNIERAKEFAAKVNKPLFNGEIGCIGRANPYDITLQEHMNANVGWYVWELMIVRGEWGHIHGVFYEDGSVRDPSIAAAIMGFFRKRSADIYPAVPDSEGWVSRIVDRSNAWMENPGRAWKDGLDIAETGAHLLESAELAPMRIPPTWEVERLRSGGVNMKALKELIGRFKGQLEPYRRPREQEH